MKPLIDEDICFKTKCINYKRQAMCIGFCQMMPCPYPNSLREKEYAGAYCPIPKKCPHYTLQILESQNMFNPEEDGHVSCVKCIKERI